MLDMKWIGWSQAQHLDAETGMVNISDLLTDRSCCWVLQEGSLDTVLQHKSVGALHEISCHLQGMRLGRHCVNVDFGYAHEFCCGSQP